MNKLCMELFKTFVWSGKWVNIGPVIVCLYVSLSVIKWKLLVVPKSSLKWYGDRSCEVVAPSLWISLLITTRESTSVDSFKGNLKTIVQGQINYSWNSKTNECISARSETVILIASVFYMDGLLFIHVRFYIFYFIAMDPLLYHWSLLYGYQATL